MIRIAAVGDVHLGCESRGTTRPAYEHLDDVADVLLLAGDLTRVGTPEEGEVVAEELGGLPVPTVAVLGNHDHHSDAAGAVTASLERRGVEVLEGGTTTVRVGGTTLGIAGTKGFGGGFLGASASAFGEPTMKAFVRDTIRSAEQLERDLSSLGTDVRVALTHYSPVADTLRGERAEIYPFLGSYLLACAIDGAGADLAVHGHAHGGIEKGLTAEGVPVRNVALPVIRTPYRIYTIRS